MVLLKLKSRLAAFSLVETLVAMIILLTLFFIGIYFFAAAARHGFNVKDMTADHTLEEYINRSIEDFSFTPEKKMLNGWLVARSSEIYNRADSLLYVNFTVFKNDSASSPFKQRYMLVRIKAEGFAVITDH